MRAAVTKLARAPVALACVASSVSTIQARRSSAAPALQCETVGVPRRSLGLANRGRRVYCETQLPWRPGFQFELEYRLELERELGHGGQGQVFLAVHKASGVSRAVKRVERSNVAASKALEKELEVMQRLRGSPHVVQVVDAFTDEKYRYVVMELCYGLDLVDAICEELQTGSSAPSIDPVEHIPHVAAVFREMVTAVAECHAKAVYHMDIKPENFIHVSTESVDGAPSVKLLDFGLAAIAGESISSDTQLGCRRYRAPEMFKSSAELDPAAADMYALGISLYNLFTGGFPYQFSRTGKPRSRPDLSSITHPEAHDLLEKLLSPHPGQRLSTREVLSHPFLCMHEDSQVKPLSKMTTKSAKSLFIEDASSFSEGRAKSRIIKEGEVLFNEGDVSDAVYFVSNGSFTVHKEGACVAKLESGAVRGVMSALFHLPRNATIIAAESSEVLECPNFAQKSESTKERYALKGLQENALKRHLADTTREFLRKTTLFRDASDELVNTIVAGSDRTFLNQGDMVQEGSADEKALYIVQDGLLEVRKDQNGNVAYAGPGEIVGEADLIQGGNGVGETLKALKPTTALVLDPSEFAHMLHDFPKERDMILRSAEWRWKQTRPIVHA